MSSRKKAEAVNLLHQVNQGGKQQKPHLPTLGMPVVAEDSIAVSMSDFYQSCTARPQGLGVRWGD